MTTNSLQGPGSIFRCHIAEDLQISITNHTSDKSLSLSFDSCLSSASMAEIPPIFKIWSSRFSISWVSLSTSAFVSLKFRLSWILRLTLSWFSMESLIFFISAEISSFLFLQLWSSLSATVFFSCNSFNLSPFLKSLYLHKKPRVKIETESNFLNCNSKIQDILLYLRGDLKNSVKFLLVVASVTCLFLVLIIEFGFHIITISP